jgi:hypothetical protein
MKAINSEFSSVIIIHSAFSRINKEALRGSNQSSKLSHQILRDNYLHHCDINNHPNISSDKRG